MQNNQDTSADKNSKMGAPKAGKAETNSQAAQKTQFGSDSQKSTSTYGQRPADQDGSNTTAASAQGSQDQADGAQGASASQAPSQPQLEQFFSFLKSNWKVIIAELAAAGVAAYLKHNSSVKDKKSETSRTGMGSTDCAAKPDISVTH